MGKWVITAFAAFAAFIGFLAFSSIKQDIDLVAEDYYAQELKYGERMKEKSNASVFNDSISFQVTNNLVIVQFPATLGEMGISGEIEFFRPSNNAHDRILPFTLGQDAAVAFKRENLVPGHYKVNISWTSEGRDFYLTKTLYV